MNKRKRMAILKHRKAVRKLEERSKQQARSAAPAKAAEKRPARPPTSKAKEATGG